ncbi:MAG: S46 family peptidase, partial [Vulcanimicrobiota bacterium]
EDVTNQIMSATKGLSPQEAFTVRKKIIAKLEKENTVEHHQTAEVVELYNGGEYWLYTYKKYRDVRLVMAPEEKIANVGEDYDNFTYPRYSLDFAIFRVYEDGKPVNSKNYLPIRKDTIKEDELVFVSGHPAWSSRFCTFSEVEFVTEYTRRDINNLVEMITTLERYMEKSPENDRRAKALYQYLLNVEKASLGEYKGLIDPVIRTKLKDNDENLKKLVLERKDLKEEVGDSWKVIDKTYELYTENLEKYTHRRLSIYKDNSLPGLASEIVFFAKEIQKPDGERLDGYHDSQLGSWKYQILSPAPVYKDLEITVFQQEMEWALQKLGKDDPYVKILLAGKTPDQRALELVENTQLDELEFRKKLIEGKPEEILASNDPLIRLAIQLEPLRREMREWRNEKIKSILTSAREKLAKARFALYGKSLYPDATFTLRLAYGTIKGYAYNGTLAPHKTTFYGLFDRYFSFDNPQGDWGLTPTFVKHKNDIRLETPLNCVITCDTLGGNSGSPVFDQKGRVIGLLFDGNIESLVATYAFLPENNRSVVVNTEGILEAMECVYKTGKLNLELLEYAE